MKQSAISSIRSIKILRSIFATSMMARNFKIRFRLLLVLLYLPFVVMQFSYKFYVIANFYYFKGNHRVSTVQNTFGVTHISPSHLTLDKRFHHKTQTEAKLPGLFAFKLFHSVQPATTSIFTPRISFSSFRIFSPRGPPSSKIS
jgi:hypothetical protein